VSYDYITLQYLLFLEICVNNIIGANVVIMGIYKLVLYIVVVKTVLTAEIYITFIALDVALVVDSSSDISDNYWQRIVLFLKGVVGGINQVSSDPHSNRFGLVSYASKPTVVFRFNTLQGKQLTTEGVLGQLDNIPRGSGDRRIDLALTMAGNDLFSEQGGQRPWATKVNE